MSPRSGPFKPREIMSALITHGYTQISQKGSHVKFRKGAVTIIVPNHQGKDIAYGLGCAILKRAGIDPGGI
jgi:predicted RNA binding protein YcfA (HicA-like mRNA interferase family)